MKLKIYKQALLLVAILMMLIPPAYAQTVKAAPKPPVPPKPARVNTNVSVNLKDLNASLAELNTQITPELKRINKEVSVALNQSLASLKVDISKSLKVINKELTNIDCDVDVDVDVDVDADVDDTEIDASAPEGDLEELTKTYTKSYSVDAGDVLDIDNRYGKVTVNTWNKNEFKVEAFIKVATTKDGAAKKMLDDVTIQDGKQGSTIWFKTKFAGDQGTSSWSFNGKRSVRIMEINYTVFMPAKNALTVNNKYGSTELPDLYGRVVVNASYGNLSAKNLPNPANEIKVKYGSASIGGLTGCEVNVAYGNLNLDESDKVSANVSYGSAKIGTVKNSGIFNVKYSGGLSIGTVDRNLKNLAINASYSGVKVGLPDALNLDFDVTVHYSSFNYGNAVNVVNNTADDQKGWKPTKNFKGTVGKGNSDKVIVVKANYGNVRFE